jgi:hypothetical protein
MFTLIQNSLTLAEINDYLCHFYRIFNSKYLTVSVIFSISYMETKIQTRHIQDSHLELIEQRSPDEKTRDQFFEDFLKESNSFFAYEYENKIKESSPFTDYFKDLLKTFEIVESNNTSQVPNTLYCPNLYTIIHDKLYIIPMWSAIMIGEELKEQEIKTRLTNNPVESWFSHLKNYILNKVRKLKALVFNNRHYYCYYNYY